MRLDAWLRKAGWSQERLAKTVKVSQSQISRILPRNGLRRPSLNLIERISVATNGEVTANDFIESETAVEPTGADPRQCSLRVEPRNAA